MDGMTEMICEQLSEYSNKLKEVEKEMVRKYKSGEDYSLDLTKANGLKMLKEEALKMMIRKS